MFADVDVNGVRLHYEKRGAGKNIIMVHGNGEDHRIFDMLARSLEKDFTLWLPDSRGHGKSSPVSEYHYIDMARDMAELIERLGIYKPLYIGASDGGITGLMLASEYPHILSGLIVCGANTRPGALKTAFYTGETIKYFFKPSPLAKLMLTEPHLTKKDLEKIAIPTLVTAGEKDLIRKSDTRFIASAVRGAEMKIYKGENHFSYITNSSFMEKEIRDFVLKIKEN